MITFDHVTITYADGSTKAGHVKGVERTVDYAGDEGWTTETGKLKLSVEAGSTERAACRAILRRSEGARVTQLFSGSIPTTSEWACCDIMRISCRRYFSGIQSFGSMVSPRAIRASKSARRFGSSAVAAAGVMSAPGESP